MQSAAHTEFTWVDAIIGASFCGKVNWEIMILGFLNQSILLIICFSFDGRPLVILLHYRHTVLKTHINRLERNYSLLLKLKYSIFSHFYLEHGWITDKKI